jgi:hypothetical protein
LNHYKRSSLIFRCNSEGYWAGTPSNSCLTTHEEVAIFGAIHKIFLESRAFGQNFIHQQQPTFADSNSSDHAFPTTNTKGISMSLWGKTLFPVFVLCSIVSLNSALAAQDGSPTGKCGFQKLTIPSPAGTTTSPTDLNDNGAIVGFLFSGSGATFHTTGFLFSGGKFTHFRFPGSADTFPHSINTHGTIVGSFDQTGVSGQHAFMVHDGAFHRVNIPGFPGAFAIAMGINDFGDITGSFNGNGSDFGFLLHQGKLTIISFPGAAGGTFPQSINNQGVIVGTYFLNEQRTASAHGFMWKNGAFTNIEFPGAVATEPVKISNNGDVVGTYFDSALVEHGFAFDGGRFSTIIFSGGQDMHVLTLNKFDNILGFVESLQIHGLFKGFCSSVF